METYVVSKMQDGHLVHVTLQHKVRTATGIRHFAWTDAEIQRELARHYGSWARNGWVMLSWRRLTDAEHKLFEKDDPNERRWYRNALIEKNGVIEHDMTKARELHRARLRHYRTNLFTKLDGEWMKASGQGNTTEAQSIEAKRQVLRDWPQDQMIEQCTSVADLNAHIHSLQLKE